MPNGRRAIPDPEVLVLGGGPAGATAASLLARWGHAVTIVTRPSHEARRAESLPPSCDKLFEAIGIREAIAGCDFIRALGNTVWWGRGTPRVESFDRGRCGWQVNRGRLDTALLETSQRAAVSLLERTAGESDIASIAAQRPARADRRSKREPFVLDCTGRAGVLARALGLRRYDDAQTTIALVGEWTATGGFDVPDDTHTLIESYEDGWAWSVPVSQGVRQISTMVDPQRSRLTRGASSREVYLAEISKTRAFRALTSEATLQDGPWGCDASTYSATRYAGDGWLLVGDAGSSVDPLSSAGVKKALASAWLAAIVTHTCLTQPDLKVHALAFFEAREQEMQRQLAARARRWLGDAAAVHAYPFWADRGDDSRSADIMTDTSDGQAVRAAHEALRRAPELRLARSPTLRVEPRPAVRGNTIALEPRIISGDEASGVRYLHDVDVLELIALAPSHRSVPDLVAAYERRMAPVALPKLLTALATAVARGWLVAQ